MYSKTTNGVTVTVTPYFLDDQSLPQESHYVWAKSKKGILPMIIKMIAIFRIELL